MSLNRTEQLLFDYVQRNPDEKRHWEDKVRALSARAIDPHAAAMALDADLWRYFEERSAVVPSFRELARHEGLRRTSLRNLAEHLLRLWAPVKAKLKAPDGTPARPYA